MACGCSTDLWRIILRVDFYHLTRAPAEQVLPQIAEKLTMSQARLLVVSSGVDQLAKIDRALWEFKPQSFLPHGIADGENDAAQPILLAEAPSPVNGARNVALADGVWRDEALQFDRAFFLFDPECIDAARTAWRNLASADGVERHYWKQDEDGKWREGP